MLPNQLRTARMTKGTLARDIDTEVGNLEQAIADILGVPIDTDIAQSLFAAAPNGLQQIALIDTGTVPIGYGRIQMMGSRLLLNNGFEVIDLGVPTATIMAYATTTFIPAGWLLCDGAAVDRTLYGQLFSRIGTQYGVGDGASTFNLPNLTGKVVVGLDPADPDIDIPGKVIGEKAHTLTATEMPTHAHTGTVSLIDGGHVHGQ